MDMVTGKKNRPSPILRLGPTSVPKEDMWLESVSTWPRGSLPTPEMLADLLRAEQAQDVRIIDAGTALGPARTSPGRLHQNQEII